LENHYEEHKGKRKTKHFFILSFLYFIGKKFYEPLLAYIGSGPVVAMV
jgi:nucleoside diphosphate kinase